MRLVGYQQRYWNLEFLVSKITTIATGTTYAQEWVEGLKHEEFSLNVRLESTFQKLKTVIKGQLTILEFCAAFNWVLATLWNEWDHRAITQKAPVRSNLCLHTETYAKHMTPYALGLINNWLELRSKLEISAAEDGGYTATSSHGSLQLSPTHCTCTTYTSQHIPRRHSFKLC